MQCSSSGPGCLQLHHRCMWHGLTMLVDLHDFWHDPRKQEHAWTGLACGAAWTQPGLGFWHDPGKQEHAWTGLPGPGFWHDPGKQECAWTAWPSLWGCLVCAWTWFPAWSWREKCAMLHNLSSSSENKWNQWKSTRVWLRGVLVIPIV